MSSVTVESVIGLSGVPVNFPTGIRFGGSATGGINDIGIAGQAGFGLGICPGPLPSGMAEFPGTRNAVSDDYGNYKYSDGSVMVWIPAFYYKWGSGGNGIALNSVDIKPFASYNDIATANAAGYALHRAFYDGGRVQPGVFVDKYLCSNNGGIASSVKNGIPLSSAQRGSIAATAFSTLTGSPANNYGGAIAAAKTRGSSFFCNTRFIFSALAMLAYAHGKSASSSTWCAWYDATGVNNFPKGCNNNALGDTNDASILYTIDGNGTYNCPLTGSANLFARTAHNGQNSGGVDLNGTLWEITPGLSSDGTNIYLLNTAVSMKSVTGGSGSSSDLWGASGLAALYTSIGTTYASLVKSNGWQYFGSTLNQVFDAAVSGNAWAIAGSGVPLVNGVGGTNAFGMDGMYQPSAWPNELCPISSANWGDGSMAGVWSLNLNAVRASSYANIGFRSALYL